MKLSDLRSRNDIGAALNSMGLTGKGAEIGVAFGENAELILETSNLTTLILVDPWSAVKGQDGKGYANAIKDWHGCYCFCTGKLARFGERAKYMRMSSVEAAGQIPDGSLDFVYIDANHASPMIDNDLIAWWPKVKSGGVFGGHDYYVKNDGGYRCDVKTAVDSFFSDKAIALVITTECASWYCIKP